METKEIFLLTAFVCSACDGDIAKEELALVKDWCDRGQLFGDIDVSGKLNEYVKSINECGSRFISDYLTILECSNLSVEDQIQVVKIAIEMIEADGQILYSEVKFFKTLRTCLSVSDDIILMELPEKADYLLPDIKKNDYTFDNNIQFAEINLITK